jgi:hypothetical protein
MKAGPEKVNNLLQKFDCGFMNTEEFTSASDLSISSPLYFLYFNKNIFRYLLTDIPEFPLYLRQKRSVFFNII